MGSGLTWLGRDLPYERVEKSSSWCTRRWFRYLL